MAPISRTLLKHVMSKALDANIDKFIDPINDACNEYGITTPIRQAHFLAQIAQESGQLRTTVENLNYSAKGLMVTWPSRFTAEKAEQLARQPEDIANYVYANRNGNGDEGSGDGWKYRGRGLIQITGKKNYEACAKYLIQHPEDLEAPKGAASSAGWFWAVNSINGLADIDDVEKVTRRVNGGLTHLAERKEFLVRAKELLLAEAI